MLQFFPKLVYWKDTHNTFIVRPMFNVYLTNVLTANNLSRKKMEMIEFWREISDTFFF